MSSLGGHPNESTALLPLPFGRTQDEGDDSRGGEHGSFQQQAENRITSSLRQLSHRVSSFIAQHTGEIGMVGAYVPGGHPHSGVACPRAVFCSHWRQGILFSPHAMFAWAAFFSYTITKLAGSVSIAVNSLTGPAMLELPALFARSGILPTCATVLLVACLCSLCSLHLANTISKVNENGNFRKEIEYSEAFRFFWGVQWFHATQVVFFLCITCLEISSIVDTAQVIDTVLGNWWPWGGTAAVEVKLNNNDGGLQWSVVRWEDDMCSVAERNDGSCTPFHGATGSLLLTMGLLFVTVIFLPLALLPLKENASYQVLAFVVLLLTSAQFAMTFVSSGLDVSGASVWGDNWDDLFGVILFNFPLVIAIPAWLYEREPEVDVPTVVHGSCAFSAALYIGIGVLGQLAMPNVSDNMLQSMMSGTFGWPLQVGASIFAFAIVGFGIPLFSVLTRLNLVGSGLCSEATANILAVYFPFALSWLLYDSTAVTKILSWYVHARLPTCRCFRTPNGGGGQ
jgi:hypothetical protein